MRNRVLCVVGALLLGAPVTGAQVTRSDGAVANRLPAESSAHQDILLSEIRGTLFGVSLGVPGYGSSVASEAITMSGHWTQLRPRRPGADISVFLLPRALAEGVALGGARANLAIPIELARNALLLPSAGLSLIGAAGPSDAVAVYGLNAGVAAVLAPDSGSEGLRVGITFHAFEETAAGVWHLEVGWVRLPNRTR